MEQIEVVELESELDKLFCLPEEAVMQDRGDSQVFRMVVETTNYRIEIEIG